MQGQPQSENQKPQKNERVIPPMEGTGDPIEGANGGGTAQTKDTVAEGEGS